MARDKSLEEYMGSGHSALGFLLFALGTAALLAFVVIAAQIGLTDEVDDLGSVIWIVPGWSLIAIPLGLALRRRTTSARLWFGAVWLAIPVATIFTMRFEGLLNG
jgi:hypothetical protein